MDVKSVSHSDNISNKSWQAYYLCLSPLFDKWDAKYKRAILGTAYDQLSIEVVATLRFLKWSESIFKRVSLTLYNMGGPQTFGVSCQNYFVN